MRGIEHISISSVTLAPELSALSSRLHRRWSGGGSKLDWKSLVTTFDLLFAAELGDKTQLAVMAMTARF
jgi:putative Ca2+/H+ antiporter (TMEM165/GDT1 family)